jgi:hypothetical protein
MIPDTMSENSALLSATVKLPQHVVFRSFPSETVMLNLQTGKYHGLNATAGRMLEELERTPCVRDAAAALAESFDQTLDTIEQDLCLLCGSLLERGLIEIDAQPPS